ncbi:RNA 2'-phosphotransferase [Haliangium ochraceum]|uniref:Probable RNA 2'-phosphotransferase n=1 Tax=Haliangium ochraceum (strain DSM 14365 / JCM 11303 / SMP-2) TaxID=502025 RepID=D0LI21_HALO1|nr:RNA 2'-phosphotransferase [Haliangium ochraceum]ACY14850.1 phosphotransferase KptA/Tpt1 [Haliangium ochraceum DSM 14365]
MQDAQKHLSRRISSLLRHRAGDAGLSMDAAGWVEIDALLAHLGESRELLDAVVQTNNKARFEVAGTRIRASQGHSLENMPVTRDALEASWSRFDGEDSLWHGTQPEVVESIARDGLLHGARSHVHLAESRDSSVGKRSNVGVLLEISPSELRAAGWELFKSPNGVILCRHVPPECIVDIHPLTKRARQNASAMRAALSLPA